MRHFSVYGKTWKMVSKMMSENGFVNKDQLQCRTHGQKYLISLQEIQNGIKQSDEAGPRCLTQKKIYQKLQKYEDDKRFLYELFL